MEGIPRRRGKLIWLNGPFGGGKTQTAHEIQRRLPGSVICDPEELGFGLHRMMPKQLRGDFQDLPAWRQGTYEVLDRVLREQPGVVIVPMTVIEGPYFRQTVGWLEREHDVHHFSLLADRDTVVRRLRERGFGHLIQRVGGKGSLRRESFALAQLGRCLERLQEPQFAEQIWTDHLSVAEIADQVAASAGLTLEPNTDSALRGRARRAWVGLRHIRLR